MNKIAAKIMPVVGLAIFAILFIVGFIFFSYLLIIGAILGSLLFAIAYIRMLIIRRRIKKHFEQNQQAKEPKKGRVIEHDEIK